MNFQSSRYKLRADTKIVYQKLSRYRTPSVNSSQPDLPMALTFHIQNALGTTISTPLKELIVLGRLGNKRDRKLDVDFINFGAKSQSISRYHAAIIVKDNQIVLRDISSLNGTYIDGEELIPNQEYALTDKSFIKLGQFAFQVTFEYATNTKDI